MITNSLDYCGWRTWQSPIIFICTCCYINKKTCVLQDELAFICSRIDMRSHLFSLWLSNGTSLKIRLVFPVSSHGLSLLNDLRMVGFAISNYERSTHIQHNHERSYCVAAVGLSCSHSLYNQRSDSTCKTMETLHRRMSLDVWASLRVVH